MKKYIIYIIILNFIVISAVVGLSYFQFDKLIIGASAICGLIIISISIQQILNKVINQSKELNHIIFEKEKQINVLEQSFGITKQTLKETQIKNDEIQNTKSNLIKKLKLLLQKFKILKKNYYVQVNKNKIHQDKIIHYKAVIKKAKSYLLNYKKKTETLQTHINELKTNYDMIIQQKNSLLEMYKNKVAFFQNEFNGKTKTDSNDEKNKFEKNIRMLIVENEKLKSLITKNKNATPEQEIFIDSIKEINDSIRKTKSFINFLINKYDLALSDKKHVNQIEAELNKTIKIISAAIQLNEEKDEILRASKLDNIMKLFS